MTPHEADLYHWIRERESVRIKREEERRPPPWTTDQIIRTTRFCNIRREDDKVTRWIKDNWRDPYRHHENLAFSMCVARTVNWPLTLGSLGFPEVWSHDRFVQQMDALSENGFKIWTGAYMVTGGFSKGGETKQEIIARVLDDAFHHCRTIRKSMKLEDACRIIQCSRGLGSFLAAQVIADLKYTPLLEYADDWWTFCSPGPGSSRGLNYLHGRPPGQSINATQFSKEVNEIRVLISHNTGYDLTAHDTQNCLCEFSKYVRIKYYKGRAKAQYKEPS
jgi:hypothetical protein